jgi:hypothetical protein
VVIERERYANARAPHDHETRGVDSRELVQIAASKVLPRVLQIPQIALENLHGSGFVDRILPGERDIPIGVAFEERERLDYDGHGGVELCAGSAQPVPLIACLGVKRIARERERDPRAAVDESGFTLPHQGAS